MSSEWTTRLKIASLLTRSSMRSSQVACLRPGALLVRAEKVRSPGLHPLCTVPENFSANLERALSGGVFAVSQPYSTSAATTTMAMAKCLVCNRGCLLNWCSCPVREAICLGGQGALKLCFLLEVSALFGADKINEGTYLSCAWQLAITRVTHDRRLARRALRESIYEVETWHGQDHVAPAPLSFRGRLFLLAGGKEGWCVLPPADAGNCATPSYLRRIEHRPPVSRARDNPCHPALLIPFPCPDFACLR